MCGIVGHCTRGTLGNVAGALRALSHRGPDDHGLFVDQLAGIALGHARLAIIDLSAGGHQPMMSANGRFALVFNGEIYNYKALRRELVGRGCAFRSESDTEVVLWGYEAYGAGVVDRLNGMFAFAVWDRVRSELFVARDASGIKPLYISETGNGFAFASELKALLALGSVSRDLDLDAVNRYLTYLWCPGEGTPLAAVRKLGPGEAAVVSAGTVQKRWHWRNSAITSVVPDLLSVSAASDAIRSTLRSAVHDQLVSDVPIGAFLSGGLDSSAIVRFASERVPDIRCFTIDVEGGHDAGMTDDLPYAQRVAKHIGVPLDIVRVNAAEMSRDLPMMIRQLDEPLADPAALNVLYISRLARDMGVKVLLAGTGGDDLFSGYRRHLAVAYQHLWSWLPVGIKRQAGHATKRLDQRHALSRRLSRLLIGAELAGDERLAAYFSWISEPDLWALYSPAARARIRGRVAAPMTDFLRAARPSASAGERVLALDERFFLADHNLLYTDKMSMAVAVEVRVPFLDRAMVDLAARIPFGLKQRGATGKWVFKHAMRGLLPDSVIYRPKSGFGVPLRRWLQVDLREQVDDVLSAEALARRGLFDPIAVRRLIQHDRDGRREAGYTVFALLCLELWLRAYVDETV